MHHRATLSRGSDDRRARFLRRSARSALRFVSAALSGSSCSQTRTTASRPRPAGDRCLGRGLFASIFWRQNSVLLRARSRVPGSRARSSHRRRPRRARVRRRCRLGDDDPAAPGGQLGIADREHAVPAAARPQAWCPVATVRAMRALASARRAIGCPPRAVQRTSGRRSGAAGRSSLRDAPRRRESGPRRYPKVATPGAVEESRGGSSGEGRGLVLEELVEVGSSHTYGPHRDVDACVPRRGPRLLAASARRATAALRLPLRRSPRRSRAAARATARPDADGVTRRASNGRSDARPRFVGRRSPVRPRSPESARRRGGPAYTMLPGSRETRSRGVRECRWSSRPSRSGPHQPPIRGRANPRSSRSRRQGHVRVLDRWVLRPSPDSRADGPRVGFPWRRAGVRAVGAVAVRMPRINDPVRPGESARLELLGEPRHRRPRSSESMNETFSSSSHLG